MSDDDKPAASVRLIDGVVVRVHELMLHDDLGSATLRELIADLGCEGEPIPLLRYVSTTEWDHIRDWQEAVSRDNDKAGWEEEHWRSTLKRYPLELLSVLQASAYLDVTRLSIFLSKTLTEWMIVTASQPDGMDRIRVVLGITEPVVKKPWWVFCGCMHRWWQHKRRLTRLRSEWFIPLLGKIDSHRYPS